MSLTFNQIVSRHRQQIFGLSTDTKPTEGLQVRDKFYETDTGDGYVWSGSGWDQFMDAWVPYFSKVSLDAGERRYADTDSFMAIGYGTGKIFTLADAIDETGQQTSISISSDGFSWPAAFQMTTTGMGGADYTTIQIEISNDDTNWEVMATITLLGNTKEGMPMNPSGPWHYIRANCTYMDNTPTTGTATLTMST